MSPEKDQDYFCEGMAEELINVLTKVARLQVASRTSAFQFKGKGYDISEIGKKLNVHSVLEGSIRKAGNKLRITAQLINVSDGYHLWSEKYDRDMEDIFAIQDEISLAIVDNLKVKLLRGEKEKLVKRYTDNLEAYSLNLRGRYYWNSLTPEGWEKSIECYQKAIEIDPTYALAHVGLSIWHQSLAFWGDVPPGQAIPKSRKFAQKAIELDDSISDAHNSLAVIYAVYDWNRSAADKEFKRTIELDPTNAMGYANYAIILANWKRFEEALVYARMAQKLDPLSSMINTWVSMILMFAGQCEEAIEGLQQVIVKDPGFWQPHLWLGFAFISVSMFEEAVSAGEKAVELSGRASIAKAVLACTYFLSGRSKKGEELLESLKERSQSTYVPATFFVWIYSARNDIDKAFHWLQKAVKEHDPWICWYGAGSDALRADDPRFDVLLKKIGLL
jgi:TolB-like protein/Tfp pilus assembly protein PilF